MPELFAAAATYVSGDHFNQLANHCTTASYWASFNISEHFKHLHLSLRLPLVLIDVAACTRRVQIVSQNASRHEYVSTKVTNRQGGTQ